MVWSLHLYGAGSRANKLYNMADEIISIQSEEPHKNNMDKEKQRKLATGRYDSQIIHTVAPQSKATDLRRIKPELYGPWIPPIIGKSQDCALDSETDTDRSVVRVPSPSVSSRTGHNVKLAYD